MNAKNKTAMGEKKGDDATKGATGSGNMNSVVLPTRKKIIIPKFNLVVQKWDVNKPMLQSL